MSLSNLIFCRSFFQYKRDYLSRYKGYVDLISITALCHLEVTHQNSSLVNPYTETILGDALKSCITAETLRKLRVVDPTNKIPLQIILIGDELFINPFFRFKCQEILLRQDVVFLGHFNKIERERVRKIVRLLGRKVVDKPSQNTLTICNSRRESKKRLECMRFENDFYTIEEYLDAWKGSALEMYLYSPF